MADEEYYKANSFEEKMNTLMKGEWKPEQIQKSAEQVAYMCKCGQCPSYTETGETETVFCTIGKSDKIKEKQGCLCEQCPLTNMLKLRWKYYCMEGSAYELSDLKKE
jgi:hypothetical protein